MMGKESSMKRYRFLLFDADKTLLDFDTDMLLSLIHISSRPA